VGVRKRHNRYVTLGKSMETRTVQLLISMGKAILENFAAKASRVQNVERLLKGITINIAVVGSAKKYTAVNHTTSSLPFHISHLQCISRSHSPFLL